MMNDQTAGMWVTAMTPTARYPARMARSPWARLITFMTPNSSDRPQANRAYRPPSKMPWMMSLTQIIRRLPKNSAQVTGPPLLKPEVGLLDRRPG